MIILYQISAVSRATIIRLDDCNNVPPLLVPLSSVFSVISSFCNQLFVLSSFNNKYNTIISNSLNHQQFMQKYKKVKGKDEGQVKTEL